jgi:hypothetical protein
MIKQSIVDVVIAFLTLFICIGPVEATVINFDDLPQGLVPNGYAGLTWGTSILSRPYADSTSFAVSNNTVNSTPHSSPNFVLNGYGVPDLWFEFPSPVSFNGAWFSAPKNNSNAAQKIRFVDNLGHTSNWLTLSDTPQYLAANFTGSKRIYVQPTLMISGSQTNGGWFNMDDILYGDISSLITNGFSINLTGTGSGSVNSTPSGYIACSYTPQTGICSSTQPFHTSFTLTASPSDDSQFISWGGACNGCSGFSCEVTLESDKSCSATINILPLVRLVGPTYYASITKAYADLPEGTSATMQTQAVEFNGEVDFNLNIPLTLKGGYVDSNFSTRNGYTIINGAMTIKSGSVIVDSIILRSM